MNTPNFPALRALAAATLAISMSLPGCGGGGSDTNATSAGGLGSASGAAAGSAAANGASSATITTAASTGSTCNIADFAATALARVNQLRAAGANCGAKGVFAPAAALTWSALLTQSSEAHSQDMAAKNFFDHVGTGGSTLKSRVDATGYAWSLLGENIAAGYVGLDKVLAGWIASPGHCANLMNPEFNQIGLVCVPGNANTTYSNYWTMDLALSP